MPRNLPTPMIVAITSNDATLCILVDLTLMTGVQYVWSGVGTVVWNGHAYQGVGALGSIGDITESTDGKADGTSVGLSGVDPAILNDCLNEIKLGAPTTIWFGVLSEGALLCDPYPLFKGTVDKPNVPINPDDIKITLALENRMSNLQRASNRRYTTADQRYYYPNDSFFNFVETLSDVAVVWGG
jgi:hypothetical protein